MLVYGDPKFHVRLKVLFENFRSRILGLDTSALDDLRSLLIFGGQLEQAISDHVTSEVFGNELEAASAHLNDCLARFFCHKFISGENWDGKVMLANALERMAQILANGSALGEEVVAVKIPEGYAFYALFPEQYCVTALDWARQNSNRSDVLVVGIRSIGTSLSAVVKETFCKMGWRASRFTVRPDGHPFERRLTLDVRRFGPDIPVLIVDEGPGISGSSMAAVAETFISAGCRNVSFLPGHSNDPGSASPRVTEIWRRIPRYVTSIENVKWDQLSLEGSLLARTGEFGRCERVQNISGGIWRRFVPGNQVEWPTSPPQFERLKYLCTERKGCCVLWKFAGLHGDFDGTDACEAALGRLSRLAGAGYCPQPFGAFRGFIAMPWIEGARLVRAHSGDASILSRMGNYIVDAAQPPLDLSQNKIAVERLADMLYWNTKELLGEIFAQKALVLADAAFEANVPFAYGDGHLAPHEWVRSEDGRMFKVDAEGHAADHTLIGEQSLLWDIAGACVEWGLNMRTAVPLLNAIEAKGVRVDLEALAFYRAAYAAFRAGLFSLGVAQVSDAGEKTSFETARAFYLRNLAGVLKAEAVTARSAC